MEVGENKHVAFSRYSLFVILLQNKVVETKHVISSNEI